jgi:hypothetical protein
MKIRYGRIKPLRCPECRLKMVAITDESVHCFFCSWTRKLVIYAPPCVGRR